ncbi:unnamed protein product [Linum trigynum]|uniref:Uncharacterized protein n=1 Tax=Linum trigynum TaxID=586398 RepID=A0AAV2CE44_9ROSI
MEKLKQTWARKQEKMWQIVGYWKERAARGAAAGKEDEGAAGAEDELRATARTAAGGGAGNGPLVRAARGGSGGRGARGCVRGRGRRHGRRPVDARGRRGDGGDLLALCSWDFVARNPAVSSKGGRAAGPRPC